MNEITTIDQGDIEVLPPARPAAADAIGQLMAHAEAMAAAKKLGDALAATDMVPKDYKNKPGNAAAAILYGAELGLNPIQSLQQIFVVHGSPAIYARTAVALVKRAGVLVETVSSTAEAVTVRATDSRTGQVEESTWDIPRATTAGYTSNERYKQNPQEMLYAKAAMEVCRKVAPDVLLGIPFSREELDMEQRPTRVRTERARGVAALAERVAPQTADSGSGNAETVDTATRTASAEPESAPPAEKPFTPAARQKWEKSMFALLNEGGVGSNDRDGQLLVISSLAGRTDSDQLEHRNGVSDAELRDVVEALGAAKKAGTLTTVVDDIVNAWVDRQAYAEEQAGDQSQMPLGDDGDGSDAEK